MTKMRDNWGGKRKGAGSGGARPGSGRPRSVIKFRTGDYLIADRETIGGEIQPSQLWRVLSIGGDDGNIIEFQCGNDIITLRPPDD